MWREHLTRDSFLLVLGAIGFLHELIVAEAERPFVLTACLALMGFPFVLGVDSQIRKRRNGANDSA